MPLSRSPALGVRRSALIAYDGPIPLLVVPMALSPLSFSMKASISFSRGVTIVHLPSTARSALCPSRFIISTSSLSVCGSTATPGPMRSRLPLRSPEGRRWKT